MYPCQVEKGYVYWKIKFKGMQIMRQGTWWWWWGVHECVYMYTNICLLIKAANDLMILRRN